MKKLLLLISTLYLLSCPLAHATDIFGTGSDGDITISGNTTLGGAMQYNSLTVNNGVTLNTAGYSVKVKTVLTNNGVITDSSSGGAGGGGGTRGNGYVGDGDGYAGSVGGAGTGNGGGGGGGGGGGAGQEHNNAGAPDYGGYASGATGGDGGAGGKGGGTVNIFARILTNNGIIHANGFNGVNGNTAFNAEVVSFIYTGPTVDADIAGGGGGGGAGGGGGGGGEVNLTYEKRTTGTVTASGGTAGAYGNGTGSYQLSYTQPGGTEYSGGAGAIGGTSPGTGGTGGTAGSGGHGEEGNGLAGSGTNGAAGSVGTTGTVTWTQTLTDDPLFGGDI